MHITLSEKYGVVIVNIEGRLTVGCDTAFKSELSAISDKASSIVFDCSKLEYIDSTGLGLIVRFFKEYTSKGGKFALAVLQPKPKMVFEITRAYKIFDIFDTVEQAVGHVAEK